MAALSKAMTIKEFHDLYSNLFYKLSHYNDVSLLIPSSNKMRLLPQLILTMIVVMQKSSLGI